MIYSTLEASFPAWSLFFFNVVCIYRGNLIYPELYHNYDYMYKYMCVYLCTIGSL